MRPRAAAATAVAVVLLSGCGTDARAQLRTQVQTITTHANARDASGVRTSVDALLRNVDDAARRGSLTPAEADRLRRTAQAVRTAADTIDPNVIARQQAEQAALDAQRRLQEQIARQAATRAPAPAAGGHNGNGGGGDD